MKKRKPPPNDPRRGQKFPVVGKTVGKAFGAIRYGNYLQGIRKLKMKYRLKSVTISSDIHGRGRRLRIIAPSFLPVSKCLCSTVRHRKLHYFVSFHIFALSEKLSEKQKLSEKLSEKSAHLIGKLYGLRLVLSQYFDPRKSALHLPPIIIMYQKIFVSGRIIVELFGLTVIRPIFVFTVSVK